MVLLLQIWYRYILYERISSCGVPFKFSWLDQLCFKRAGEQVHWISNCIDCMLSNKMYTMYCKWGIRAVSCVSTLLVKLWLLAMAAVIAERSDSITVIYEDRIWLFTKKKRNLSLYLWSSTARQLALISSRSPDYSETQEFIST